MKKQYLLVTNNSLVFEKYKDHTCIGVLYLKNKGFLDVLIKTRDYLHSGWHLLTHPQAGNLKPVQCPYKTILISEEIEAQPFARDIELMELSVEAYYKFTRNKVPPKWPSSVLADFEKVDLSVIESGLRSDLMRQMTGMDLLVL